MVAPANWTFRLGHGNHGSTTSAAGGATHLRPFNGFY